MLVYVFIDGSINQILLLLLQENKQVCVFVCINWFDYFQVC